MSKLTDTQLIILSKAAERDDGAAMLPHKMSKAVAIKAGASLVAKKLMREVRAKPGQPVWREDEDSRPISLIILKAGRKMIGVEGEHDQIERGPLATAPVDIKPADGRSKTKGANIAPSVVASAVANSVPPRAGSKQALIVGMLSAETGTTIGALIEATGWLPHTTRAALTGLRKRGFLIERSKGESETSVYRIASLEPTAAHAHKRVGSDKADAQASA